MNKIIDNKTYESSPSHFSCKGCVGWDDIELCRKLAVCEGIIWKEVNMNTAENHQEDILIAMARKVPVQMRANGSKSWFDWSPSLITPLHDDAGEYTYRVKPEPKPDVVDLVRVHRQNTPYMFEPTDICPANLKLTFDGETGDIKSAEVIK